jgi:parvulin-like peptidyl-prolyl isomerase
MAKSSKKRRSRRWGERPKKERRTKKQIARSRRETRQNRIILLSVIALILAVASVLTIGLLQEFVVKPAKPVAVVNGTKVRTDHYQSLLKHRRFNLHANIRELQSNLQTMDTSDQSNQFLVSFYQQQLQQLQASLGTAPQSILDEMIDDVLIQERAEEAGITVTEADVEDTINEQLRRAVSPYPQTPITDTEQLPTPTPIPQAQLDDFYKNILNNMGLSNKEFHEITRRGLYRSKVQDVLAKQVVTTGLVVHVQLIQTDTAEEAAAAKERIESGEDFAIVAQEVSTDTQSAENGGDLGWVTTGQLTVRYGQNVEDLVFSMQPGEVKQTESSERFYVVQVLERDENGPLPTEVVNRRQSSALADWLAERKESPDVQIERLLEPDQIPEDPFATTFGAPGAPGSQNP